MSRSSTWLLSAVTRRLRKEPLNYVDTPHEWWVGPTGTGKSKKVWEEYPTHYAKKKNKWWCNYTGQDTVVVRKRTRRTWNTWPTG